MGTKVAVFGAAGRMGTTVCHAVHRDGELELVAAVDVHHIGQTLADLGGPPVDLSIFGECEAAIDSGAEVVVDFTTADAARENLLAVAAAGVHAVVGTTGFTEVDFKALKMAFTRSNCVVAPNFAISAVLMMRFAELAAPFFDTAEVIEYHHNMKTDAPSGTAITTAQRLAKASTNWAPDPTETEVHLGARGGEGAPGIRIHSIRMEGKLAHQDVILGAIGQTFTLRQDSYDRSSFMPGILLACKRIADYPGVTIGLDDLLDI